MLSPIGQVISAYDDWHEEFRRLQKMKTRTDARKRRQWHLDDLTKAKKQRQERGQTIKVGSSNDVNYEGNLLTSPEKILAEHNCISWLNVKGQEASIAGMRKVNLQEATVVASLAKPLSRRSRLLETTR